MSKTFNALKDLTEDELKKKLAELKLELVKLNAQRQSSINSKVSSQIRKTRKDIARILTILNSGSANLKKKTVENKAKQKKINESNE
ncbi:MAG: Ribosomal protein [Candidatus Woesearchaeota archaeon]|nr:Ribosomal protein [Candidatus Woesearchaeota archaeon]MDN5327982.1 Ribosomal protein [Candidatus Woesearchaeota archaeon]